MNPEKIIPWAECEANSYAVLADEEFPIDAVMHVPQGFEGVAVKDVYTHEILYPGDYSLEDKLNRVKKGFKKAYLTGKVAYINKNAVYNVGWGTGKPVVYYDKALGRAVSAGFSGAMVLKADQSEAFAAYALKKNAKTVAIKDIVRENAQDFVQALNPALQASIEKKELDFKTIPARLDQIALGAVNKIRMVFAPMGLWIESFTITGYTFPNETEL